MLRGSGFGVLFLLEYAQLEVSALLKERIGVRVSKVQDPHYLPQRAFDQGFLPLSVQFQLIVYLLFEVQVHILRLVAQEEEPHCELVLGVNLPQPGVPSHFLYKVHVLVDQVA